MVRSYEEEEKPRVVKLGGTGQDEEEAEGLSWIYSCANGRDLYRPELAILEPNA